MNEPSAAALKQQWRQRLKMVRQKIDPQRRQEASTLACGMLKTLTRQTRFILSFASFGSEIDLRPFNQALAEEGRLVLPRIDDRELHLYQIKDLNHLEPHKWGFLEPLTSCCTLVNLQEITIALIPGLGFDPTTNTRIGYGEGYYDRLLASLPSAQAWGIGFREQLVDGLPCDPHDKPLDAIYLF